MKLRLNKKEKHKSKYIKHNNHPHHPSQQTHNTGKVLTSETDQTLSESLKPNEPN